MPPKPREVMHGWRYFHCKECHESWKETCRDHATPSRSCCITPECKANLTGGVNPYRSVPDANLKTDGYGNLADDAYKKIRLDRHEAATESFASLYGK